jgi:type IV pilus assembly protein PilV
MKTSKNSLVDSRRTQSGVTLIEVLITVVIISIGLLGIAALQLTSLRSSTDSVGRSKATWLAADIIDHMRANAIAARAGAYVITIGDPGSGATVAKQDLIRWKTLLLSSATNNAGLPLGDGSITLAGNIVTVTLQWQERATTLSFVTQTEI